MKAIILPVRQLTLAAGAALLLLAAAPGRAQAAFVLTLSQVGGNVVVNGSGTLNFSALTLFGEEASSGGSPAAVYPVNATLIAGPGQAVQYAEYMYNGGGLTGPASIGTGTGAAADSGTGAFAGISFGGRFLNVPAGYVSGAALTDSSTYTGQTFATLGFTPGTYVYTWGTGANADSLTITSVPEPSTWALLGVGAGLLALGLRQRSRCV